MKSARKDEIESFDITEVRYDNAEKQND